MHTLAVYVDIVISDVGPVAHTDMDKRKRVVVGGVNRL